MKRLLCAIIALLGLLFVYGLVFGESGERMRLTAVTTTRLLTVTVNLPDLDDRYRWLSVYGCSAQMLETGTYCTGDFERESTFEILDRSQYLVAWRDLPGGTMQITAVAFDVDDKAITQNQITVFRGR